MQRLTEVITRQLRIPYSGIIGHGHPLPLHPYKYSDLNSDFAAEIPVGVTAPAVAAAVRTAFSSMAAAIALAVSAFNA